MHNHVTPAIRRGDLPPFTVLKGLLLAFNCGGRRVGFAARYDVHDGEDRVEIEVGAEGWVGTLCGWQGRRQGGGLKGFTLAEGSWRRLGQKEVAVVVSA